jgi:hypothetical protein
METLRIPAPKDPRRVLWMGGDGDDGGERVAFKLWLLIGKPLGELEVTMGDGVTWVTTVSIDEIAIFKSEREDLLDIYMTEMILNARAGLRPRVH